MRAGPVVDAATAGRGPAVRGHGRPRGDGRGHARVVRRAGSASADRRASRRRARERCAGPTAGVRRAGPSGRCGGTARGPQPVGEDVHRGVGVGAVLDPLGAVQTAPARLVDRTGVDVRIPGGGQKDAGRQTSGVGASGVGRRGGICRRCGTVRRQDPSAGEDPAVSPVPVYAAEPGVPAWTPSRRATYPVASGGPEWSASSWAFRVHPCSAGTTAGRAGRVASRGAGRRAGRRTCATDRHSRRSRQPESG